MIPTKPASIGLSYRLHEKMNADEKWHGGSLSINRGGTVYDFKVALCKQHNEWWSDESKLLVGRWDRWNEGISETPLADDHVLNFNESPLWVRLKPLQMK